MDLTIFASILGLRNELYQNLSELMTPASALGTATKTALGPDSEPKRAADLLRRMSKERETVLAALSRAKPTTEAKIKALLRAAAAPLSSIETSRTMPSVKAATPRPDATPAPDAPKTKTKAKAKKKRKP